MQPQPGGGELPLREEQRSEGARHQQAVHVDQAHHTAPRAQARRCGVQQSAAGASELRSAAEVIEDAAACVGAAAAAPTAAGGAAAEAARGAAEERLAALLRRAAVRIRAALLLLLLDGGHRLRHVRIPAQLLQQLLARDRCRHRLAALAAHLAHLLESPAAAHALLLRARLGGVRVRAGIRWWD